MPTKKAILLSLFIFIVCGGCCTGCSASRRPVIVKEDRVSEYFLKLHNKETPNTPVEVKHPEFKKADRPSQPEQKQLSPWWVVSGLFIAFIGLSSALRQKPENPDDAQ